MEKPVTGYEDEYTIFSSGEVFRVGKPCALSTRISNSGYIYVQLWKNNKATLYYIHRLLGQHFIPNPCGLEQINHIDGNKQHNSLTNLEWVTRSQNTKHAIATGLKVYTNKLPREKFIELLLEVIAGKSYAEVCEYVPYKVPFLSTKLRKIAKEEGLNEQLTAALYQQKVNRNRKVLKVINENRRNHS